jgi:uncharacterized protein (TIGR03067 family)
LKVAKPGFQTFTRTYRVMPGESESIRVRLERLIERPPDTPKPKGPTDQEMLQGHWKVVREISLRKELKPDELAKNDKRLEVNGNHFKITSQASAKPLVHDGTFRLNPDTIPKQFDWEGAGAAEKGVKMVGIYEFMGSRFRLCYRMNLVADKTPPRPHWSDTTRNIILIACEKVK